MENPIIFYHFSTKESLESVSLSRNDIAFCKESRTVFTDDKEYLSFTWSEIPSANGYTVTNGSLMIGSNNGYIEEDSLIFSDPSVSVSDSTVIVS